MLEMSLEIHRLVKDAHDNDQIGSSLEENHVRAGLNTQIAGPKIVTGSPECVIGGRLSEFRVEIADVFVSLVFVPALL